MTLAMLQGVLNLNDRASDTRAVMKVRVDRTTADGRFSQGTLAENGKTGETAAVSASKPERRWGMSRQGSCCSGALRYNVAFTCSGASDVGAVADQAARRLSDEKKAFMCCAAAIAAEVSDIREKAASAAYIVVIDGCEKACAKTILDRAGLTNHAHVELGALGMERGKTPVNEENIAKAACAAAEALAQQANRAVAEV